MKRPLLTGLLAVFTLILLALVGGGILLATLNPNDYKENIRAAVHKATGRNIHFGGDIQTTLFPWLGLKAGGIRIDDIAEFGAGSFAEIGSLSLRLAVLPLLEGKVEVAEILLSKASVNLIRSAAGRGNWDFSKAKQTSSTTGVTRLEDPQPAAPQSSSLALNIAKVKAEDLNLAYKDLGTGTSWQVQVPALALQNIRLGADIPLSLKVAARDEVSTRQISLALTGTVRLQADSKIVLAFPSVSCVFLSGPGGKELRLDGELTAQANGPEYNLGLKGTLGKTPLALQSALRTAGAPGLAEGLSHDLQATLDIGDIDIDALLQSLAPAKAEQTPAGETEAPTQVLDKKTVPPQNPYAALLPLRADIAFTAKGLKLARLPFTDVRLSILANKGDIQIVEYAGSLFGGQSSGIAGVDLRVAPPKLRLTNKTSNLPVKDVLGAIGSRQEFAGQFSANLDVAGQTLDWKTLAPTLSGTGDMRVNRGYMHTGGLFPKGLPGAPTAINITTLSASARVQKGVATIPDFLLQADLASGKGSGVVDLVREQITFAVEMMLGGVPPALPLEIKGPLASPSVSVATSKLLEKTAKDVLDNPAKVGTMLEDAGSLFKNKKK